MSYLLDRIAGDEAGSGEQENEKLERYTTSLKLLEKAKIARDVAGKGFGGAVIDWAKEGFMDAGTQNDVEAYNEIGNILTRLEKEVGDLKEDNLTEEVFEKWNVHIHVPEGAIPKDGPSAGITMATSLASAFTQRKVRARVAMTGEITLRGKVLPVGGIKEKILAAKRSGMKEIILSEDNRKDIEEINEVYLKGLTFHYVKTIKDVWNIALTNQKVPNALKLN